MTGRGHGERSVRGALGLTVGTVVLGVVGLVAFDQLFSVFHEIFFPAGSYLFDPTTDRLVQLFPFAFWDETALVVGRGHHRDLAGRGVHRRTPGGASRCCCGAIGGPRGGAGAGLVSAPATDQPAERRGGARRGPRGRRTRRHGGHRRGRRARADRRRDRDRPRSRCRRGRIRRWTATRSSPRIRAGATEERPGRAPGHRRHRRRGGARGDRHARHCGTDRHRRQAPGWRGCGRPGRGHDATRRRTTAGPAWARRDRPCAGRLRSSTSRSTRAARSAPTAATFAPARCCSSPARR